MAARNIDIGNVSNPGMGSFSNAASHGYLFPFVYVVGRLRIPSSTIQNIYLSQNIYLLSYVKTNATIKVQRTLIVGIIMQLIKEEIKQRIIAAARIEFLQHGYEKASIRTITARAGTSKSNIYNYFRDKDNLFCSVVEPVLLKIGRGLELSENFYVSSGFHPYTEAVQEDVLLVITDFILENLDDVKLLLFHAKGSSLENYKNELTDTFTAMMCRWVKTIRPDKEISRLFVKCISYAYLGSIEVLLVNGVFKEQAEQLKGEALSFIYHGWQGVFRGMEE